MSLFGYKGCEEKREYEVILKRKHSDTVIIIAEQLTEKEAKRCYNELKTIMLNKNNFIEFKDIKKHQFFVPKDEVGKIQIYID